MHFEISRVRQRRQRSDGSWTTSARTPANRQRSDESWTTQIRRHRLSSTAHDVLTRAFRWCRVREAVRWAAVYLGVRVSDARVQVFHNRHQPPTQVSGSPNQHCSQRLQWIAQNSNAEASRNAFKFGVAEARRLIQQHKRTCAAGAPMINGCKGMHAPLSHSSLFNQIGRLQCIL